MAAGVDGYATVSGAVMRTQSDRQPAERRKAINAKVVYLIAGLSLVVPLTGFAQSADANYCATLAKLYRATAPKHSAAMNSVPAAIAKCEAGDYAVGIPVLEKALTNAKVELPARS